MSRDNGPTLVEQNIAAFIADLWELRERGSVQHMAPRIIAHIDLALMIAEDRLRLYRTGRTTGVWIGQDETDMIIEGALANITRARSILSMADDLNLERLLLAPVLDSLHRLLTLLFLKLTPPSAS